MGAACVLACCMMNSHREGQILTLLTPGALSLKGARTASSAGLLSLVHAPHTSPQSAVGSAAQGSLDYPTSTEMM